MTSRPPFTPAEAEELTPAMQASREAFYREVGHYLRRQLLAQPETEVKEPVPLPERIPS